MQIKKTQFSLMLLCLALGHVWADPCPEGWRGMTPNCTNLADLISGRGPCTALISDDFTTVNISCPMLGNPTDATWNIELSLTATAPSNSSRSVHLPSITTIHTDANGTEYAQVDVSMPLVNFRSGADYFSPSDSVDVYRSNLVLKLENAENIFHTVRYRLMVTVNRLVKASSGIYVAQTVDGEDITAIAKALTGIARWCINQPVPTLCTPHSNVYQVGDVANVEFALVSSVLPVFIQSGRCVDFSGNQVWSIASGWTRYANGAGAASVSFVIPDVPNCIQFQWTASVPALTASQDWSVDAFEPVTFTTTGFNNVPSSMSWFNGEDGTMLIQSVTPTVAASLDFSLEASNTVSAGQETNVSTISVLYTLMMGMSLLLAHKQIWKF